MNRVQRRNSLFLLLGVSVILLAIFYFFSHYGSGRYYVYLFPQEDGVKNYKVEADIEKAGEYYVTKAYFPNGGYLNFEESYGVAPLEFDKKVELMDQDGDIWYVQLGEKIQEKSWIIEASLFAFAIALFVLSLCLIYILHSLDFFFACFELEEGQKPNWLEGIINGIQDWLINLPERIQDIIFWSSRIVGVFLLIYLIFKYVI